MASSASLHKLIHSMNPNEKRYFRIHASRHVKNGKNNYMKLFEALEQQKQPDEKRLASMFKGKKTGNNVSRVKHYLYQLI